MNVELRSLLSRCRCIDCGFALAETATSWPTCKPFRRQALITTDTSAPPGARSKQEFTLNGGSGTHIDAPAHFIVGGRTVDMLRPDELAGVPLAVVDVHAHVSMSADFSCTVAHVLEDEACFGEILPGSLVCLRTGWAEARYGTQAYYNFDENNISAHTGVAQMHFPGFAEEAAAFLAAERRVVGIGVDTLSPDPGSSTGFKVHHTILGADRYILENLSFSANPPARGAVAFVSPLAIQGAPESPTRVWVLVPNS